MLTAPFITDNVSLYSAIVIFLRLGNSEEVELRHYAQVTEADIQEAAKMSLINEAMVHCQGKRVQTTAAPNRTEPHEAKDEPIVSLCNCENEREVATPCEKVQKSQKWAGLDSNQRRLTPTGLQPVAQNSQVHIEQQFIAPPKRSVQTCVQTNVKNSPKQNKVDTSKLSPERVEIVAIWPELPEHIKAAIKALVQTYTAEKT